MSWSDGAMACERFGSCGLGRPRWGIVTAWCWERGAVGVRSTAKSYNDSSCSYDSVP